MAALGVVLARNPVHSAVSLVLTFVNVAGIYVILRAEFLAAVQIIVYTGAILVLVLFVIMLVHQEDLPDFHGGQPVQRVFGFLLGLMLLAEVAAAIVTRTALGRLDRGRRSRSRLLAATSRRSVRFLYSGYVLPIQATAVVLLVATIGALRARPSRRTWAVGFAGWHGTVSRPSRWLHPRGDNEEESYADPIASSRYSRQGRKPAIAILSWPNRATSSSTTPAWGEQRADDASQLLSTFCC